MRWAVIGASGRTGREVVARLLAAGHDVEAMARHATAVLEPAPRLSVVDADVRDVDAVRALVEGCQRVVCTVGVGASRAPTTVYSDGVAHMLEAIGEDPTTVLAVISAAPVGDRQEFPFLDRAVVMPMLDRFFGTTYADLRVMESLLASSAAAWVCLRPPRLIARAATGSYRVGTKPLTKARSITTADLVAALIESTDEVSLHRTFAYVAN